MAAEDLQPATANNHSQGAAALQHQGQDEHPAEAEPEQPASKGNWLYKSKKLYQNQPSKIRYVVLGFIIIILVVIVAGIGVAISKAAGKTEVQHLVLAYNGKTYKSVFVVIGQSVQISLLHIEGFTSGPTEIVIDFEESATAFNEKTNRICFVRDLDTTSLKSVEDFSDALENTWTDVINLTASSRSSDVSRWRTHGLSSTHVRLSKPHAADSMDCQSGDYEVLSPPLPATDPEPTAAPSTPIRADFGKHATCERACFPRFATEHRRDNGIKQLVVAARDCFYYGNCRYGGSGSSSSSNTGASDEA